jgi:hypothetical protein
MKVDRDKLFGGIDDPVLFRQQAYAVIDRTQDHPEMSLQAIGLTLYAMCEALDVDIRELLTAVERIKTEQDGPFVYVFRAIEEYTRNETGPKL